MRPRLDISAGSAGERPSIFLPEHLIFFADEPGFSAGQFTKKASGQPKVLTI